jgi:hypothetical protein
MVILNGRFDGKQIVLDEVPEGIAPNTPVRVIVGNGDRPSSFAKIAAMAIDAGLPKDFAAQHEHYMYGTPKQ